VVHLETLSIAPVMQRPIIRKLMTGRLEEMQKVAVVPVSRYYLGYRVRILHEHKVEVR
jgi:hypothetical protein